jgi:hypothetical protein
VSDGVISLIKSLIVAGDMEVTQHGIRELAADRILIDDVVDGVARAVVIEDYPDAQRGPSVLVLQRDRNDSPIHLVWGVPKDGFRPAVLITAYRPDPRRWSTDFTTRRLR